MISNGVQTALQQIVDYSEPWQHAVQANIRLVAVFEAMLPCCEQACNGVQAGRGDPEGRGSTSKGASGIRGLCAEHVGEDCGAGAVAGGERGKDAPG